MVPDDFDVVIYSGGHGPMEELAVDVTSGALLAKLHDHLPARDAAYRTDALVRSTPIDARAAQADGLAYFVVSGQRDWLSFPGVPLLGVLRPQPVHAPPKRCRRRQGSAGAAYGSPGPERDPAGWS